MGLFRKIKQALLEPRSSDDDVGDEALLFSIEELPNPRDTGTLYVSCGKELLTFLNVTLDQAGIDASLLEITRSIEKIRACNFREIRFINISASARNQIETHLSSFGLHVPCPKTLVVAQG